MRYVGLVVLSIRRKSVRYYLLFSLLMMPLVGMGASLWSQCVNSAPEKSTYSYNENDIKTKCTGNYKCCARGRKNTKTKKYEPGTVSWSP